MKANTRGQFKGAACPRRVMGACDEKEGASGDFARVYPRQKLVFVITLLNDLFSSLFISWGALVNEKEVKPVFMLC